MQINIYVTSERKNRYFTVEGKNFGKVGHKELKCYWTTDINIWLDVLNYLVQPTMHWLVIWSMCWL